MKTLLITGCSSGFGLEISKYFLDRNWKVVATMRTPDPELLPRSENLSILPLDVTNAESISAAVEAAGPIDALVNNAGIGFFNALEGTPMEKVREIFETNTFGTIAMTQAVLPQLRESKAGVIVNVTSSVTLKPLPLLSIYTASKAAINAFTKSLAEELEPFNVRACLVLPGQASDTRFVDNARGRMLDIPAPYAERAHQIFTSFTESTETKTRSQDVAEAVWSVVTDPDVRFLPAGTDAIAWAGTRETWN